MLVDTLTEFCDNTTLNTGAPGKFLIGNQINLEDVRDIGHGEPIYAVFVVTTTVTSAGAATVAFDIASDSTAAISTSTSTLHATVGPFPKADLVAGTIIAVIALPDEGNAYEQFLGILQVTGTAALTAGAIDAFLTMHPSGFKGYPDGEK